MQQFGRVYRLEIGNDKESINFDNLRVTFSIEKTITLDPNLAEISIYNLNASHRALITTKQYNYVRLYVSYVSNDLRMVFSGDIVKVQNKREDLDFITVLSCADGYEAFTDKFISKTITNASDLDVVNSAVENMGIQTGSIDLPNNVAYVRGKVMMCDTREVLNKVARNNKADWSLQDNQLVILPKNKVLGGQDGFILSERTGMIGSPQKTDTGIEVDTLCNPHFKIGSLVRIESILKELNGDYKIVGIAHNGDIYGEQWTTKLTCEGGEFTIV